MLPKNQSLLQKTSGRLSIPDSPQTQQMMRLGRRSGWGFKVLGYAEMPEKPVRLEKWLIIPAHEDNSQIPSRTVERIQGIFSAGLRPRGFVVVHEAPRVLGTPNQANSTQLSLPNPDGHRSKQSTTNPVIPDRSTSSSSIFEGLGSILLQIATTIFPLMFWGLMALDPIVIAVMDDGCWVEIDRWNI